MEKKDYSHTSDYGYGTGIYASVYSKYGDYHLIDHYLDDGSYWINCEEISFYKYGNNSENEENEIKLLKLYKNYLNPFKIKISF